MTDMSFPLTPTLSPRGAREITRRTFFIRVHPCPSVVGISVPASLVFALALLFWGAAQTQAAEPLEVRAEDLPRTPALSTNEALKSFELKPGFKLELAAAEPNVVDPIAFCFDEESRLFVVEMRDYSERRQEQLGRIRLLEDRNGDGFFETSSVFAEDLPWPTALFWANGGLFVGATPDLLFFRDRDGDNKAEERKVVFTGFAAGQERLNVQAMINNLQWTLDNRIHGSASLSGGRVRPTLPVGGKPVDLRGKDFSFDPRDLSRLFVETGGGQHGLSFDDTGRKFICHNSFHIRLNLYEERYGGRNPHYAMPSPVEDIPVDGPAAEVYRISPEEPWRVLRTAWRVGGKVPGPIEGGGRASGYFTSATGITIYRGDAFPEEYAGDAFIADVGSNLIHRKKIHPNGVSLQARRAAGEEAKEFLASKDLWFRPVQLGNAPDGSLYFADMYREYIEHPWSLPEPMKKLMDLNSGNDRGRIYRIVPEGHQRRPWPNLKKATGPELAKLLEHRNGWHRDTASRLIYERQDQSAVPNLRALLAESVNPIGRLHALYALRGLGELTEADLLKACGDADSRVRRHAARCIELQLSENKPGTPKRLAEALLVLAGDSDLNVLFQTALSLGIFQHPEKPAALSKIVARAGQDRWIQAAVLNATDDPGALFRSGLTRQPAFPFEFTRDLLRLLAAKKSREEMAMAVKAVVSMPVGPSQFQLARALIEGAKAAGAKFEPRTEGLGKALEAAERSGVNTQADETIRIQALELLGAAETAPAYFMNLLTNEGPQAVQAAAVRALNSANDRSLGEALIERWAFYLPLVRSAGLTWFLARPDRAETLLNAMEAGKIKPAELTSVQRDFLLKHRDARLKAKAGKLLKGSAELGTVVAKYEEALRLRGKREEGRAIFRERCASCHRLEGEGHALGPDLVSVKSAGKDQLLANIIDPNKQVTPNYLSYVVETKDGESAIGVLANESANAVSLKQPNGIETVFPRTTVASLKSQGTSVMPEGLEAGLTAEQMADLIEFIMSATGN